MWLKYGNGDPNADIEVSRECELWFEKGQIEKGDDIADYYLGL